MEVGKGQHTLIINQLPWGTLHPRLEVHTLNSNLHIHAAVYLPISSV